MMVKLIKNLCLLLFVVSLFASCGKEHQAKSMVEDFLDTHLVDNSRFDVRFSKLDSTRMITPKAVASLREHMRTVSLFKPDVTYGSEEIPHTLYYIRVSYNKKQPGGKEERYTQTFYFDKEIQRIIAFKEG